MDIDNRTRIVSKDSEHKETKSNSLSSGHERKKPSQVDGPRENENPAKNKYKREWSEYERFYEKHLKKREEVQKKK